MCGIIGFTGKNEKALRRCLDLLSHRGPDGEGMYMDDYMSIGHRRLSIIDLSDAASQPMYDENGRFVLVFNGEIYNYIELREELRKKGHQFVSDTDSECIIHGYEEWGLDVLSRFNGMFAFCLYDRKKKELFLARDRFGVKPLYYQHEGSRFVFSSEIKPLLELSDGPRRPYEPAIFDYLLYNFYNHDDQTFFEGVSSLLPGHYLIFDLTARSLRTVQWYEIPLDGKWQGSFDDAKVRFRELFHDAIRLRLRSDVEIGTCLSGGLDSSSIVCSLKGFDPMFSDRFKSFSVVFPDTPIDELPYVNEVIKDGDFEGHFVTPTVDELMSDLNLLVKQQEEPFSETSIFAQWAVMRLAHGQRVKVLLDGQGGDELLAGYPFFFGYLFLEKLKALNFAGLAREVAGYRRTFSRPDAFLLLPLLLAPKALKEYAMMRYFHSVVDDGFIKKYSGDSVFPSLMYSGTSLNVALRNRVKYSLPQLLRHEDKNSMSFAIEARLPFLDYRLVEFLFSLPSEYKLHGGVTKYLLRESMKGILPAKVYERRSKLGFPTPLTEWIRDEKMSRLIGDVIFSRQARARGYYDMEKLSHAFKGHMESRLDATQIIWKVFNLETWMRTFME